MILHQCASCETYVDDGFFCATEQKDDLQKMTFFCSFCADSLRIAP